MKGERVITSPLGLGELVGYTVAVMSLQSSSSKAVTVMLDGVLPVFVVVTAKDGLSPSPTSCKPSATSLGLAIITHLLIR